MRRPPLGKLYIFQPDTSKGIGMGTILQCKCGESLRLSWDRDVYAHPQKVAVYCRCGNGFNIEVKGGWRFGCTEVIGT